MYRVSYNKLIEILGKGGCSNAIYELKERKKELTSIETIEVYFTIDDRGTENEVLTVTEFNIYCQNTVLFGVSLKHETDFTIQSARTTPYESFLVLTGDAEVPMPDVDKNTKDKINFLTERALDACEYADTEEERKEGYTECDEAKAIIAETLQDTASRLKRARNRTGDFARYLADNYGNHDDELNGRIDEIYNILEGK